MKSNIGKIEGNIGDFKILKVLEGRVSTNPDGQCLEMVGQTKQKLVLAGPKQLSSTFAKKRKRNRIESLRFWSILDDPEILVNLK